jgi:hypothetical protein
MYIFRFICWNTGETLEDEPRRFSREDGQMFLEKVNGQSINQFDREEGRYYTYTHYKSILVSPKANKVTKYYDLLFKRH